MRRGWTVTADTRPPVSSHSSLRCNVCDKVNAFGFGADRSGSWHHYWEENAWGRAFRQTGVHDGDYEYNITQLLAEKGKIRLFRGVSKALAFQWDPHL
ncbi:hypothetical protein AOLI_G00187750 [Acnodon oligacanthus]